MKPLGTEHVNMFKITHAIIKIVTKEPREPGEPEKTESVWFPLDSTEEEIGKLLTEKGYCGCYFVDGYDPESGKVAHGVGFSPYHMGVSFREIKEAVDVIKEHFAQQE